MEHQAGERDGPARSRVGEQLAAARAAQGISLPEIATRTRVPLRSLELLEAGETMGLPALTYTAGFVRTYADALGLDGGDYARRFRIEMGRAPQPVVAAAYEPADPARVPSRLLAIVALAIALLVAGGYAIWRGDGLFGGGAQERARLAAGIDAAPPATVGAAGPAIAITPVPPATVPAGPVVIEAKEPAWVKVYERDGPTLRIGTLAAGDRYEVPARAADPLIRTSRAQALTVTVGGIATPPLGPPDTLIKDRSLRREALTGTPAGSPTRLVPLVPQTGAPAAAGG